MRKTFALIVAACLLFFAGTASAAMLSADIREILHKPTFPGAAGPRVLETKELASTPLGLDAHHEVSNPSHWAGFLGVFLGGNSFMMDGVGVPGDSYQVISIVISNIVFSDPNEYIAGVELDFGAALDELNSDPFTETITFTDNSISLLFVVDSFDDMDKIILQIGGQAFYKVDIKTRTPELPTPVSEPASLALFGAAIGGLALSRRRRTAGLSR